MRISPLSIFINFLSLLPGTLLTILTIAVAFLRFYDEQDFTILGQITEPRLWSNRLTLAALVVAVVNFGIVERSSCEAWNRRNRETNRLAEEDRRRSEEATRAENERITARNRAIEERERTAHLTRIQNRWYVLQIRYQLQPNESTRRALNNFLAFIQEYGE